MRLPLVLMAKYAPGHRPLKRSLIGGRQRNRQNRSRLARINDSVVPEPRRREIDIRLFLYLVFEHLLRHRLLRLVYLNACAGRRVAFDDVHHAGELLSAHHGDAVVGPGEDESRVVGATAHGVIARAVTPADHQGDGGHGRIRDRVDQLRAAADDSLLFVTAPDHKTRYVLQEQQWDVLLVAEVNELRAFFGGFGNQHAVVAQNADQKAMNTRPAGNQCRAVFRLELLELRSVDDARDHLFDIERNADVGRSYAEQFVNRIERLFRIYARRRRFRFEMGDDFARDPQTIQFVFGQIIRQAGNLRMHLGAAQRLFVNDFASGHLDQRGPAEKDLRLILHHHDVIGHSGQIGAASRRIAEDDRDARYPRLRAARDLFEACAARHEDFMLNRKIGAGGFDQRDRCEMIRRGDLSQSRVFALADLADRAAFDRRFVGDDQTLAARDKPNAADHAHADEFVLHPVTGQRRNFEKIGAFVEQHLHALARRQLASRQMALDVLFASAERRFLQFALQPLDAGQIGGVVGAIGFRVFIDERFYRSHFVQFYIRARYCLCVRVMQD